MAVNVRIRNGMAPSAGSGGAGEGDIRGVASDILSGGGVVKLLDGHLLVHQKPSPDMNVIVDEGVGYIPNASFDETDSDQVRFWEAVVSGSDASRTVAIASNSSGQTRVDLIVLQMDTAEVPDSTASDVATLIRVAGTPGAGAPATPSNALLLAQVTVVNGATDIDNADISDQRVQVTFNNQFYAGTRVTSTTSSATPTPNIDTTDLYVLTALATNPTFAAPTGTPTNGKKLLIRIKDNGTARTVAWNSIYRAIGLVLPNTTTISKTLYVGAIYNSTDVKWDVVYVGQEF